MRRRVEQGRSGRRWAALRARVFAEETHCYWCGKYVDQDLPPTHPMSRTADHVEELALGGAPLARSNLRLAHRRCNTVKSNRLRSRRRDGFTIDTASL